MEGLKGRILRGSAYLVIIALLLLAWLHSPEKTEEFISWLVIIILIYFFLKMLVDQYFDAAQERKKLEKTRYENIMKQLEEIKERIDEVKN